MTQPDVFRAALVTALDARAGLNGWTIDYWRPKNALTDRHIWCDTVEVDMTPLTAGVDYERTYTLTWVVQATSSSHSDTTQALEAAVVDAVDEIVDQVRESPRLSGVDHCYVDRVVQTQPELPDQRPGSQARVSVRYRSDHT